MTSNVNDIDTAASSPVKLDLLELLDIYVEGDQKVWEYDRNLSLGASEAFGCIRKAYYAKSGADKDPDFTQSWGALRRGDLIENYFLVPAFYAGLKKKFPNARFIGAGNKQRTLLKDKLSATSDGMIIGLPRDCLAHMGIPDLGIDDGAKDNTAALVIEFKSIDPRVSLAEEKAIHNGQTQVQMGLIRELTPHTPNFAIVFYVNCSFFDDTHSFVVPFNQKTFDVANKRSDMVFAGKDGMEFRPEGRIDSTCEYCPFKIKCISDTLGALPPDNKVGDVPDDAMEELYAARDVYQDALSDSKNADKAKKDAGEIVKELLRSHDVRRAKGEGWSVSLANVKGRKTLDTTAVQEAGIDLEPFYKTGSGHEKLTIK